ncbi:MAG: nucleoside triphosphate pyrophosphohydrolase [Clostridium sp.]|nr:nucleoside triphosphate pyrophosphohydrolase [Clostridium sp.]
MINVVGLGPGDIKALTIGTIEMLKNSKNIYLRTQKHPTVKFLEDENIDFETYDDIYNKADNFDDVYKTIAQDLIDKHEKFKNIVYAVPGHPLVAEKSVSILLELCKDKNIEVKILPAVSFIDAMMEALNIDPIGGLKIIDSFDMKKQQMDKRCGLIITQVYNKLVASNVKLALQDYYNDDTEIYFVRAAGIEGEEFIKKIPLYELDWQDNIDYLTSVYIPKDIENTMDFLDLLNVVEKLRGEDGCDWDREQTHESMKKCLIEECYEVIEAIDEKDDDMIIEELGDVLLQVVFHSEIGKEEGYYNINDVINGICKKMIIRHPNIFKGNKLLDDNNIVKDSWEKEKMREQGLDTYTESLKHIPKNLPSLMRAEKIQKKTAKFGFDFKDVDGAINKVSEELNQVKHVYKGNKRDKIKKEIGDLAFSVVNVARFLDIDTENALNYTIDKFIKRFEFVETSAIKAKSNLDEMETDQMDKLWDQSENL